MRLQLKLKSEFDFYSKFPHLALFVSQLLNAARTNDARVINYWNLSFNKLKQMQFIWKIIDRVGSPGSCEPHRSRLAIVSLLVFSMLPFFRFSRKKTVGFDLDYSIDIY